MKIPSISFTAEVSSNIRELFERPRPPRPRPHQVPIHKHVSWRLKKKWFNRFQKPYLMEMQLTAVYQNGQQIRMKPTDIKLVKRSGRMADIEFKTEPIWAQ